jgi:hypothetical protein
VEIAKSLQLELFELQALCGCLDGVPPIPDNPAQQNPGTGNIGRYPGFLKI